MRPLLTILLTLGAVLVLAGCGQSSAPENAQAGDYGSDSYLDDLYDACEAGDAAACEDLYLESPVDSEYEAFAIEQGGDDFGDSYPGGETTQAPEPEQVSLGDTFEVRGFEWTVGEVTTNEGWTNPESYGGEQLEGAFLLLTGTVKNVSDDYQYPDSNVNITVYTDQTSYDVGSTTSIMGSVEENLLLDELAPDASKTGAELLDIGSAEEEVVYIAWEDPETFEPLVELRL